MKTDRAINKLLALAVAGLLGTNAYATFNNFQGFETDTGDWKASAGITRVASGGGTLHLPSSSGNYYAELLNLHDGYGYPGFGDGGYSFYGGEDSTYHGSFYQAIDVYINVNWTPAAFPWAESFWIDMTPYHADPNNYGAEHNFRVKALGGSVAVYVDGQATPMATLTSSGWYTFQMIWRKAANPTDPVITDMVVFDAAQSLAGTTTVYATSPGGPFLSQDLRGNGYVWITVWQNGFANDVLALDNVRTGLVGPTISSIQPTVVAAGIPFTLTANVDDFPPGIYPISSASYSIDGVGSVPMTALDGTFDETSEVVTANVPAFTTPGVHTIGITATDTAGNTSTESVLLAVYDPSAGFVTGGGWILSPPGALTLDPDLTGKATFGFVSKYQKGANLPSGTTDFQFKAGGLSFNSTSYDWLVIAGPKAQYKGTGTINAAGAYKFMLTATDGQLNGGGGVDTFRIKIWDPVTNTVIYDNQLGASDTAAPSTALGGGSIVIHK